MSARAARFLQDYFPFNPTAGQATLFGLLGAFLDRTDPSVRAFLLTGYAGTGKTTLISTLVKVLRLCDYKSVLMAPTGRAAKVMATYSGRKAFTLHKIMFKQQEDPDSGRVRFGRQKNYHKDTVFIVDEASMMDDAADYGERGLLSELLAYVFEQPDANNLLILVGDPAQLPPVRQTTSPALEADYLSARFGLRTANFQLTEVMRQEQESGILANATAIRQCIQTGQTALLIHTQPFRDIFRMTSEKLEDGLRYAYRKFGIENTIIICRSNKMAVLYNRYIRQQIRFMEGEMEAGDLLMIVRNNYFWLPDDSQAGFLANGDFVEVMKVIRYEEEHGMRFAQVMLRLTDYPDHYQFEAKVHLDTLHSNEPTLGKEEQKRLYESVLADYADSSTAREQLRQTLADPYLNALQVKFAYALTCHKAQGGQWDAVFVDLGFVRPEEVGADLLRWLYTAMTRASSELYLVNLLREQ